MNLISHTAPSEAAREIVKDLHGNYFLSKGDDVESRTSRALQEMFEAHKPSAWFFGHFHFNREFSFGQTWFRCLAEMSCAAEMRKRLNHSPDLANKKPVNQCL
jgi:hypothetical protein